MSNILSDEEGKLASPELLFAADEFYSTVDRNHQLIRHVKIGQIPVSTGRPMFFDFITGEAESVQFPPGLKPGTYDVYIATSVPKHELAGFEAKLREAAEARVEGEPATNFPIDEDFDALYMRFNDLVPDGWERVQVVRESGKVEGHWLSFDANWAGLADRATIEAGEVLIDATEEEIENADPGYDPRRPDPHNDEAWAWLESASNAIVPYGKGPQHRAVVLSSHGDETLYPVWGMKGDTVCVLLVCTRTIAHEDFTYFRRQPDGRTVTIYEPRAAEPAAPTTGTPAAATPLAPTPPSPAQAAPSQSPTTFQPAKPPQPRKPWWKRLFGG